MKKFIIFLLLLEIAGGLIADRLDLDITPDTKIYNVFYASWIDPANSATQPHLFNATITNTSNEVLSYDLKINLTWSGNSTPLLDNKMITAANSLEPNANISLTNQDLISKTDNNYFTGSEINFEDLVSAVSDFENIILETGRFPDGLYTLTVTAMVDNEEVDTASFSMTISNPVAIKPAYPGVPLGMSPMEITDAHPTFVWVSTLNDSKLEIYEIANENVDGQAIEASSVFYEASDIVGTSHAYPINEDDLAPGKIYAWRISGTMSTPLFNVSDWTVYSDFYVFKVAEVGTNIMNPFSKILLEMLENSSQGVAETVIALINEGYVPTGNFSYNGEAIDLVKLMEIAKKISVGTSRIKSISVD